MKHHSVQVDCYSGSRADERPRNVVIDGREHRVTRLLTVSIEEAVESKERVERFTVLTDEGLTIQLIRAESGEWHLVSMRG
jgi:hypothetical protein